MNITDPIRWHAEQSPDHLAIVRQDGKQVVTYREFDQAIDAVAGRVSNLGLVAGNTVGLASEALYPWLTIALALARLGIASAPMSLPPKWMIAYIGANLKPSHAAARFITVDQVWGSNAVASGDAIRLPPYQDGAAVVRFFASSGTTGTVKHVAITHDMIARRVHSRNLMVPLPNCPSQIAQIGLGTHFGFKSIVRVLWVGGRVVLPGGLDKLSSLVERHQVNSLVLAPVTLEHVIASMPQGAGPFPSLETIEFGGSPLPRRLYDLACARLCPNIVSLYGTTEAGAIAAAPMAALIDRPGAVGYVHAGVEIEAVDADDKPLPPGSEGILRVRSDTCVDGYVDLAASSTGAFKGGWFYPGDVGTVSGDGLLTLAGRASEVINSGGVKVSPQVIEDVLLSLPEIRDAAAFGAPDAGGITQIWAAIVPNGPVNAPTLRAACFERLLERAPRRFLRVKRIPRNAAGKILRGELTRMAIAAQARRAAG